MIILWKNIQIYTLPQDNLRREKQKNDRLITVLLIDQRKILIKLLQLDQKYTFK